MQCPNCGNEPPEGSAFCNRCGQRLRLEPAPPSTSRPGTAERPAWYRDLVVPEKKSKREEQETGIHRIQMAISGKQPRKWVAELLAGQQVRITYADGHIRHRTRRPWEGTDASLLRYPWTDEEEGALLLIVGDKPHRFSDLKTGWVAADHRVQVYLGIEDARHDDNTGHYGAVLEIASGPGLE